MEQIAGPAGRLDVLVNDPDASCTTGRPQTGATRRQPRAAVVLAHPHPLYGGTMHTKVLYHAAKAFCRLGCAVLRFNFRGVGTSEGTFGNGLGEVEDCFAVLEYLAGRYPGVELWAGGVSFGAWVAMTAGANDARVAHLIGLGPPVAMYDFAAVASSAKPKYFINGERDEVCPLEDLRAFYAHAEEPKELAVIEGADHLFDGHLMEVAETIEQLMAAGQE